MQIKILLPYITQINTLHKLWFILVIFILST